MKGIILAGGRGSRLLPVTSIFNKHLVPVYDKPMIYYPISLLISAGVRDILIITSPDHLESFKRLIGTGDQLGVSFRYALQERPRGIADALLVGRDFIGDDRFVLHLGDNIFIAEQLPGKIRHALQRRSTSSIFTHVVDEHPERYGLVIFDAGGHPLELVEKPVSPTSNVAITGLYVYAPHAVELVENLAPSARGELEITDLNNKLLDRRELDVLKLENESKWLDAGTPEGLHQAALLISQYQKEHGWYVGCIEEQAWNQSFINREELYVLGENMRESAYGRYILSLLQIESKLDEPRLFT